MKAGLSLRMPGAIQSWRAGKGRSQRLMLAASISAHCRAEERIPLRWAHAQMHPAWWHLIPDQRMHCSHSLTDMHLLPPGHPSGLRGDATFPQEAAPHFLTGGYMPFSSGSQSTSCWPRHSLPQDTVITAYCPSTSCGAPEAPGGSQSPFCSWCNLLPQSHHLACHSVLVNVR